MFDRDDSIQGAVGDDRTSSLSGVARSQLPADEMSAEEDVLTMVCFKCGTEYYFSEGSQPSEMACEKCGNTVFRSFSSPQGDEVVDDFEESTGRDMRMDDAEGETLPGDVLDLGR